MPQPFVIPSVFTAVDRFTAPIRRMSGAVNKFVLSSQVGLARAERAFRSLLMPVIKLNRVLMGLGLYVGLYTLIRVVENVVKTMADFEQAQVNISAVTGKSISQNKAWSDQARMLAVRYGTAATEVSKLQLELEKLGGLDVLKITEPILQGATGLNLPADKFGALVGAVIKSFPELESVDAKKIVDQMVYVADKTAIAGEDFETFLRTSMGAAREANRPFSELLAVMGALRNEAIQMASGGTAAKNIFIDSQILKGGRKNYQELIQTAFKSERVLKKVRDFFNRRSAPSALVIGRNIEQINEMNEALKSTQVDDYAMNRALKSLDSIHGRAKLANTAYGEFILGIDDGQGVLSYAIRRLVDISRAILYLSTGTEAANAALQTLNPTIIQTASRWLYWINVVWGLIKALIFLRATMLAVRLILFAITAAQFGWSVALAISVALNKTNVMLLKGNIVALKTLRLITVLTTASQWGLNAAMYASPLIIFVLGALAVVGVMKLMGSWLEGLTSGFNGLSGSIDGAASSLNSFYMNENLKFKEDPVFRQLNPDQTASFDKNQVFKSLDFNSPNLNQIIKPNLFRAAEQDKPVDRIPMINPRKETQNRDEQLFDDFAKKMKIDLNINDPGGNVGDVRSNTPLVTPKITSTMDGFRNTRE